MSAASTKQKIKKEYKLLKKFAEADQKTICYLYDNYLPAIINYVCKNGGNEEDAKDVFQEALLVVYKQSTTEDFHLTATLKTYIFSICRFQWLKKIRKNKKNKVSMEDFDLMDLNSDIAQMLEKAEKFVLLQHHLSKLNSTSQQIMDLHFQRYSTDEIAHKLGLSSLYVKKRKYECKKNLIDSIQCDPRFSELI